MMFLSIVPMLGLASCQPKKAVALKDAISQKERIAFNMLVGKEGSENRKLGYFINGKYDSALAVIDQQENEFNELISELDALPVEGIKEGAALKDAAKNYYTTLKELQLLDRLVVANRKSGMESKGEQLDSINNQSLELSNRKLEMYKRVHEKEELLYEAQNKFNAANGLK